MHSKREMRKNKKMNEDTKSLPSTSINWYPGHMAKTMKQVEEDLKLVDIVIEILDARIPISSQNPNVQKLIKTVSENMEDYQVVSGTQIKILIKEGVKNEQKANEILTAIDSSKNTFNIKLNYDEQGYVNSIDITVYEKK